MNGLLLAVLIVAGIMLLLAMWRNRDRRADSAAWARLAAHQEAAPKTFDPALISDLPAAAQRYFLHAIKPGAPLHTVAVIFMQGQFGLGDANKPNYLPMLAEQILAPPHGFVWQIRAGAGLMRLSGSDGAEDGRSWSQFWLLGIAPVARAGGTADHFRSAFGRYVAEAVFWTPAALLPSETVRWDPIDEATVRVTVMHRGLEQSVELSVDPVGRLTTVSFQRWSDANPAKQFQLQPFGGYLSDYRDFGSFRLPTRIEAGNFFGTGDYFPFFNVVITDVHFPIPTIS